MHTSSRQLAADSHHSSSGVVRYAVQGSRACVGDPRDASGIPERFVQVCRHPVSSNRGNVLNAVELFH